MKTAGSFAPLLRDVAACVGFYSRLPLPAFTAPAGGFANTQWAAPLAGALIGGCGATVLLLALSFGLSAQISAALALVATILVSGALHEDGLADVTDGFGGGRTCEQKLAIMKDSRIGTYGVLALILSVLLRWSALATMGASGALPLVAAHSASRALMPALMYALPPARNDGVSSGMGKPGGLVVTAALVLGAFFILPAGTGLLLLAVPFLAIVFLVVRKIALHQLGGQTGDVLGSLQQGAETALLLVAVSLL